MYLLQYYLTLLKVFLGWSCKRDFINTVRALKFIQNSPDKSCLLFVHMYLYVCHSVFFLWSHADNTQTLLLILYCCIFNQLDLICSLYLQTWMAFFFFFSSNHYFLQEMLDDSQHLIYYFFLLSNDSCWF